MTSDLAFITTALLGISDETSGKTVIMATDNQLRQKSVVTRIAVAAVAEDISRREWGNAIADVIYGFEGTIYWADGRKYEPSDTEVDDVFNDPDFRWISDLLTFAEVEPRQRPQRRVTMRLHLFYLYFAIKHPERAKLLLK